MVARKVAPVAELCECCIDSSRVHEICAGKVVFDPSLKHVSSLDLPVAHPHIVSVIKVIRLLLKQVARDSCSFGFRNFREHVFQTMKVIGGYSLEWLRSMD